MGTPRAWRERIRHEQDLIARLRIAALRFVDAQTERMWAMVAAQRAGLSVRLIGAATALSASRVHQIISAPEATEIPQWLNEKRVTESPSNTAGGVDAGTAETQIRNWLGSEVALLRRCIDWLQRLEVEESITVNLRLDADGETDYVGFDRPRVVKVLQRIAADMDDIAQHGFGSEVNTKFALPAPKQLTNREQRAALRAQGGLPPE
jgi:hypothetical protein